MKWLLIHNKMRKIIKFKKSNILFILISIITFSCIPVKKLSFINDIDSIQDPSINPRVQKPIMPFDKLYIKVFSIDEKTNLLFNSNENTPSSASTGIIGNLVDKEGYIFYPFVGKIKVSGYTTTEASLKVEEALNQYVTNASVVVKFIDNSISILGEVQNQGSYSFSQDKLNIYEALALGGGLTSYGDRKKIILIRQEGERIMYHKLDLSDSKIADKEYFYVQANDILVVEPLKNKSYSFGNNTISIIFSSISTIITILLFAGVRTF